MKHGGEVLELGVEGFRLVCGLFDGVIEAVLEEFLGSFREGGGVGEGGGIGG